MIRVITAPEAYKPQADDVKIFLAGGITKCPDWQQQVIDLIDKNAPDFVRDRIVLFNPRRKYFDIKKKAESKRQVEWEFKYLEMCDIFTMYFCDSESVQPICMYELGRYITRMQMKYPFRAYWEDRIVVASSAKYSRYTDVRIQMDLVGIYVEPYEIDNLEAYVDDIITAVCNVVPDTLEDDD